MRYRAFFLRLLLVAGVLGALGCDRGDGSASAATATPLPPGNTLGCPLGVAGAHVDVAETTTGAALRILAPADHVDEIRQRVRDAAKLYGIGAHKGMGHNGLHLGAQRHGLRLTELPSLRATVVDVGGGARLDLAARVPEQAAELRALIRSRADVVNAGPCD